MRVHKIVQAIKEGRMKVRFGRESVRNLFVMWMVCLVMVESLF